MGSKCPNNHVACIYKQGRHGRMWQRAYRLFYCQPKLGHCPIISHFFVAPPLTYFYSYIPKIYRIDSPSSSTSLTIFLVALTRGCWPLFSTLCILLKYLVAKSTIMPLFFLYSSLSCAHNFNADTHAEITVLILTVLYALFVLCVYLN